MVYIISDIHGEYDLFIKLLRKVNFSINDEMIICGDVIDKGRDSVRLLRLIKSFPAFHCIIGNHEYEFLKYYWQIMQDSPDDFEGVLEKLQEYFPYDGRLLDWDMVDWLEALPYYIERENFICVHAGIPMDVSGRCLQLSKVAREELVYDRNFKSPKLIPNTDKCIFFGHTPTSYISETGKIIKYKRTMQSKDLITDYAKIHLDLGVWLHGILGCFCVDTCEEFYVEK